MKNSFPFNRVVRFAFVCLLVVSSQLAFAQSKSASLSGIVKDASGAAVPGASVTVRNVATNQTRQTQSDDHGRYVLPNLDIGGQEITVNIAEFQPTRVLAELSVGQQTEVDITLTLAGVSERVEVTAGQLTVETRSSTYGQLVSPAQIQNLPLNGRDFSQLILLQLGVVQARSDQGDILTGKGAKISVHGARTSQNSYLLDGTDILDALGRNAASAQGVVSGIESVQEFTVLTNTYRAEYGRAAGGVFNIATRAGTNEFHGSLFEFLRNSALDARNFFEHGPGAKKPPLQRNQFGATAGGPIVKDNTFFFGAYEGFRERLGLTDLQAVPSRKARQGGFLPAGKTINPAVLPYLALIPEPTIDNPNGERATFLGQFQQVSNLNTYNVRVDHNFSTRDSLFIRYTQNDSDFLFLNPETFPDFANSGQNKQKFLTVGETRVFSSHLVNSFRYAFNRTTPTEAPTPKNGFTELAFIPGQIVGDFFISGFKRFGTDRNTPRSFFQDIHQFSDDLSVVRGPHLIKLGTNIEYFRIFGDSQSRNRGEFTINTFSDFLQGMWREFVGLAPGQDDTIRNHRQWLLAFYFQDDWKLRSNLTLNLGLRYEFITVPTERDGKVTNVRTPLDPAVTIGGPLFQNPSLTNFSPRIGLAFSPGAQSGFLSKLTGGPSKTSIRAGFGIYDDQLLYSVYGNMTFKHPPFFKQVTITGAPPFKPFKEVFQLLASGQGDISTFAITFDPSPTYVLQYNLNIQREFSSKLLVTAAYVGARGNHLWREADWNIANPLNPPLDTLFPPVPTPQQVRRRNPNFGSIRFKSSDAQSFYNAFQLGVLSKLGRGFRAQLSYTLGKSIDDQSSSLGRNEFGNGQARSVDPFNRRLNRGLSDFDVRHSLSINFSYELPFGPGRALARNAEGLARALVEGWQINGIFTSLSGIPVTPIFTFDQDRDGSTDNEQRPNLASGVTRIPTNLSKTLLFDPSVFALPPVGSRGTLGRNIITGPGLVTFDPGVAKSFYLNAERTRYVQFRAEFFNIFNHPNFAIPEIGNLTVFNSATQKNTGAGQLTKTSTASRQVQFALRIAF